MVSTLFLARVQAARPLKTLMALMYQILKGRRAFRQQFLDGEKLVDGTKRSKHHDVIHTYRHIMYIHTYLNIYVYMFFGVRKLAMEKAARTITRSRDNLNKDMSDIQYPK